MTTRSFLAAGTVVAGDFVVVGPLDEGGMGAVYRATQTSTAKERALKVMHPEIVADPSMRARFEREARVGARIASDHVVEVVAAGVDEATGLPYLVMELLEGEDLRARLDDGRVLGQQELFSVFEQLCHAMAAAHAAGVVHRDLKPENVFLARSRRAGSDAFMVKVLDFGIAKLVAEAGTRATRGAMGSPAWMAPEQTQPGPVTPAADVWALGLLAYELMTGKSFWRAANAEGGTTAQLLREIVLDPIPTASERAREQGCEARLATGFDRWFGRCVAREPAERFADASAAWSAMQALFRADAFAETGALEPPVAVAIAPTMADTSPPERRRVSVGPSKETPLATAQSAPPPRPSGGRAIAIGAVLALGGIGAGVLVARRAPPEAPQVKSEEPGAGREERGAGREERGAEREERGAESGEGARVAPTPAPTPAPAPAPAPSPSPTLARAPSPSPAPAPSPSPTLARAPSPSPSPSRRAKPRQSLPGGFTNPTDVNRAVTWKVGDDHRVRLFTRLVKNDTNVVDGVVREAVDYSSWEYLRCYERIFKAAKDPPAEGVVTVGFDVLDQLPRHAAKVSSTFTSARFDDCVVRTLLGQTINAAGPDGRGHVVYAFRFVLMN